MDTLDVVSKGSKGKLQSRASGIPNRTNLGSTNTAGRRIWRVRYSNMLIQERPYLWPSTPQKLHTGTEHSPQVSWQSGKGKKSLAPDPSLLPRRFSADPSQISIEVCESEMCKLVEAQCDCRHTFATTHGRLEPNWVKFNGCIGGGQRGTLSLCLSLYSNLVLVFLGLSRSTCVGEWIRGEARRYPYTRWLQLYVAVR